jgi:hypothetical protein
VLERASEAIHGPRRYDVHFTAGDGLMELVEARALLASVLPADAVVLEHFAHGPAGDRGRSSGGAQEPSRRQQNVSRATPGGDHSMSAGRSARQRASWRPSSVEPAEVRHQDGTAHVIRPRSHDGGRAAISTPRPGRRATATVQARTTPTLRGKLAGKRERLPFQIFSVGPFRDAASSTRPSHEKNQLPLLPPASEGS